jgi:hypothetical protein
MAPVLTVRRIGRGARAHRSPDQAGTFRIARRPGMVPVLTACRIGRGADSVTIRRRTVERSALLGVHRSPDPWV